MISFREPRTQPSEILGEKLLLKIEARIPTGWVEYFLMVQEVREVDDVLLDAVQLYTDLKVRLGAGELKEIAEVKLARVESRELLDWYVEKNQALAV